MAPVFVFAGIVVVSKDSQKRLPDFPSVDSVQTELRDGRRTSSLIYVLCEIEKCACAESDYQVY